MNEIPLDIVAAAVDVIDSLGFETGGPIEDKIARAILAERERCLKVAADYMIWRETGAGAVLADPRESAILAAVNIAAAIRKGA